MKKTCGRYWRIYRMEKENFKHPFGDGIRILFINLKSLQNYAKNF